jgi:hypothetical protein
MEEYKKFVPDPKEVLRGHIADPNMSVKQVEEILGQVRGHIGKWREGQQQQQQQQQYYIVP